MSKREWPEVVDLLSNLEGGYECAQLWRTNGCGKKRDPEFSLANLSSKP